MAACMDYSDTPDSWAKRLMDFRRRASELTALSRVLKRTRHDRSSFHFDMEPIVSRFAHQWNVGKPTCKFTTKRVIGCSFP